MGPRVDLDDLPAIHAFCLEEDARLRKCVESLHDKALTESVALGSDSDDIVPRWLIVAHVADHGTQHRSELARYFTECSGHSPGDIDLLDALHVRTWPGDGWSDRAPFLTDGEIGRERPETRLRSPTCIDSSWISRAANKYQCLLKRSSGAEGGVMRAAVYVRISKNRDGRSLGFARREAADARELAEPPRLGRRRSLLRQ